MSSRALSHSYPTQSFLWHILATMLTLLPVSSVADNIRAGNSTRGGGEPKLSGR